MVKKQSRNSKFSDIAICCMMIIFLAATINEFHIESYFSGYEFRRVVCGLVYFGGSIWCAFKSCFKVGVCFWVFQSVLSLVLLSSICIPVGKKYVFGVQAVAWFFALILTLLHKTNVFARKSGKRERAGP